MHATHAVRDDLLPTSCWRAGLLGWLWILPQGLLCLLNLRDFNLVRGEMTLAQMTQAGYVGAANLGLLATGCVTLLALRLWRRPLTLRLCGLILLIHTAYLWWFTANLGNVLPSAVAMWILPTPRVLYTQFALIMPILFYAVLRLASFPVPWSRGRDIALTFVAAVACLLPWALQSLSWRLHNSRVGILAWSIALTGVLLPFFLAARASWCGRLRSALTLSGAAVWLALTGAALLWSYPSWRWYDGDQWCIVTAAVLLIVGGMLHILRLLIVLAGWLMSRGPAGRTLVAALVGLAGPLGGLILNRHIPFPADYQCVSVYTLAIVNAALLLIPASTSRPHALVAWLLQAVMFPFTFYFFVVFLPFLPLATLAIVAVGAGFLVLAPTALFLFHGQRLLEGLRLAQVAWGPRRARLALAAALAVLPLALTTTAFVDRAGLRQAMAYVFEPAYAQANFSGSRALVRRTLIRMVNAREGRRLPILSACYNQIVFGGLVLPEPKLKLMQDVFFGGPLPVRTKSGMLADLFGQPQRTVFDTINDDPAGRRPFAGPAAVLADCAADSALVTGGVRTLLTVTMTNTNDAQAEFVTRLHLPAGVLVTGLWLYMEQERVAGQLFEKQAAMWVYRMITSSRRDPALLIYTAPETAELRVFPFAPQETRTVELELLHPRGQAWTVQVGDRIVTLPVLGRAQGAAFATDGNGTGSFLIHDPSLPTVVREPYLHFIVDQSAAAITAAPVAERVRAAAARFPTIPHAVVTLANYEFVEPAGATPRPIADVLAILERDAEHAFPPRGGFCRDRAIQRALTQRAATLDDPETPDATRLQAPVFVVLPASSSTAAATADSPGRLAWFRDLALDFPCFYQIQGDDLALHTFAGTLQRQPALPPALEPVVLVRGDRRFVALPQAGGVVHVDRLGDPVAPPWQLFKPDQNRFAAWPALAEIPPGRYRQGLGVWAEHQRLQLDPSQSPTVWPDVVHASKVTGVLVPATAWIVVESAAQWKMLARKEAQKLGQPEALALRSVPDESGTLMLLGLGLLALIVIRRRRLGFHLHALRSNLSQPACIATRSVAGRSRRDSGALSRSRTAEWAVRKANPPCHLSGTALSAVPEYGHETPHPLRLCGSVPFPNVSTCSQVKHRGGAR